MPAKNTLARSLHDLGLASWFGGSLMGAIGLNGAAAEVADERERARVAAAGWARWTPVNAGAIAAHGVGAVQLLRANKGRMAAQKGVTRATAGKTALTLAALGATAYARVLGQRLTAAGDVPVEAGVEPSAQTPPDVAGAQRQLAALQWAVPALTGGALVVNSLMGEQQRPRMVVAGIVQRVSSPVALAGTGVGALSLLGYSLRRRRKSADAVLVEVTEDGGLTSTV